MGETLKILLVGSGFIGGIVGLAIYAARLIYTGKLVPRSTLEDRKADFAEQIAREREISDTYRLASENNAAALQRQSELTEKVLEEQKLIKDFILSLKRAMELNQQEQRRISGRQHP